MPEDQSSEGIQNYEVTTAAHLFNPEQTFWLTNELNEGKPKDEWVGVEVYPTLDHKPLALLRTMGQKFGLQLPIPPGVTPEQVHQWQTEYPNTVVKRVHLPFSYNRYELFHRPFLGELGNDPKEQAFQIAWLLYFGAATNRKGVELAHTLSENTGEPVGINAHTNVLEGFAQDGSLDELKQAVPFILAENERDYNSPIVHDRAIIADPKKAVTDVVKKYNLDGLLLGVDHAYMEGVDTAKLLEDSDIVAATRAMHLAKSHHDVVVIGDQQIEEFLAKAAKTRFTQPVSLALDYNPLVISKIPQDEQVEFFRHTLDWIKQTQAR